MKEHGGFLDDTTHLMERARACFPSAFETDQRAGWVVAHGQGTTVTDIDGKEYIEFTSQNTFGHCHPMIMNVIRDQITKGTDLLQIDKNMIELAEAIKEACTGQLRKGKIVFSRSGTEVCEYAVGLGRSYSKRPVVLSFHDSFHGLTGGTLGLTNLSNFKCGSNPLISEAVYAPFPNCYRCIFGKSPDDCALWCLRYLEEIFDKLACPKDIAACIIEPVQIDGGVNIAPRGYLPSLKKICDEHGIMFVDDEIYVGFGRTGKIFAIEHWDVEPDIMCLGKAMGGGIPLAAIVARKEILDSWKLGDIAMRPNSLAVAAALAHIRLLRDDILRNVTDVGNHILSTLRSFMEKFEIIGDVRGKGLLIGVEVVKDRRKKTPGTEIAQAIKREALRRGLIFFTNGRYAQVLTITPSLTITMEEADRGLDILEKAITSVQVH